MIYTALDLANDVASAPWMLARQTDDFRRVAKSLVKQGVRAPSRHHSSSSSPSSASPIIHSADTDAAELILCCRLIQMQPLALNVTFLPDPSLRSSAMEGEGMAPSWFVLGIIRSVSSLHQAPIRFKGRYDWCNDGIGSLV